MSINYLFFLIQVIFLVLGLISLMLEKKKGLLLNPGHFEYCCETLDLI